MGTPMPHSLPSCRSGSKKNWGRLILCGGCLLAGFLLGMLIFGSPWHLPPAWGDIPTWVTAVATVGLLAGAIITAVYAVKAFRGQADQLAEQRKIMVRPGGWHPFRTPGWCPSGRGLAPLARVRALPTVGFTAGKSVRIRGSIGRRGAVSAARSERSAQVRYRLARLRGWT